MKILLYIPLVILFIACGKPNPRIEVVEKENLSQKEIDSILDEYSFEYSKLIFIDSTDQVLFPISTQSVKRNSRSSTKLYGPIDYPQFWNVLFYDNNTGETRLLTESKYRISDIQANLKNVGSVLAKKILYRISDIDYNKDNSINQDDPNHLFISKIDGSELVRISPINENLDAMSVIPNSNDIIFKTIRDVNQDLVFDKSDEIIWYKVNLSTGITPIEIINSSDRKLIENLYFKHWLVKK